MAGSLSAAALLTGAAVALVAFLALGLGRAARRAGLAHPRALAVSVAAALVVWLGAVVLFGTALGGILLFSQFRKQPGGEEQMSDTRYTVDHVRVTTQRPFEDVVTAFERQLGRFDPEVSKALAASADAEGVRAKIEAMARPSGFMRFGTSDHGSLLRLAGQKRKAVQYVIGNPLFALRMTRHDVRAALYAPLRVLLYENEEGKTCVEYDRPSSLFGQFGNASVAEVAARVLRTTLCAPAAPAWAR